MPPASTSPTASAAGRDADAAGRPAHAVREAARPDRPQLPRDGGSGGSPTGAILATAENYRRDPVNRLVRAVLDAHLLGDVYLMTQQSIGGDDEIIITPWRHLKDKGAIGLDIGAHYTDLLRYYFGEIESVFGRGLIAEPVRRRRAVTNRARARPRVLPRMVRLDPGRGGGDRGGLRHRDVPDDLGRERDHRVHPVSNCGWPDPRCAAARAPRRVPGSSSTRSRGPCSRRRHPVRATVHDRRCGTRRDRAARLRRGARRLRSDFAGRSVRMGEVLDSTVSAYQDDIDAALGLV